MLEPIFSRLKGPRPGKACSQGEARELICVNFACLGGASRRRQNPASSFRGRQSIKKLTVQTGSYRAQQHFPFKAFIPTDSQSRRNPLF
jgi:hypothetical protein